MILNRGSMEIGARLQSLLKSQVDEKKKYIQLPVCFYGMNRGTFTLVIQTLSSRMHI